MSTTADNSSGFFFLFALLLIVILIWCGSPLSEPEQCNVKLAKNREFEKYFDINDTIFSRPSAFNDGGDPLANKVKDHCSNFYRGNIPISTLQSNSFVLFGAFGTGKSHIMNCAIQGSDRDSFIFKLKNDDIDRHFEYFAAQVSSNKKFLVTKEITQHWSSQDFMDTALLSATHTFIEKYQGDSTFKANVNKLGIDLKVALVNVLCIYHDGEKDVRPLQDTIKGLFSWWEIPGNEAALPPGFLSHLKIDDKMKAVRIRSINKKIQLILAETFLWLKRDQIDPKDISINAFYKARLFPVLMIDGLDESKYLFTTCKSERQVVDAFKTFLDSSLAKEVQNLVIGGKMRIYYSFPNVTKIRLPSKETGFRDDKIPVINLEWTVEQLVTGYCNHAMDTLRSSQGTKQCATLPTCQEMTKYDWTNHQLRELKTPREMNLFMSKLFIVMNSHADIRRRKERYIATKEEVTVALKQVADLREAC